MTQSEYYNNLLSIQRNYYRQGAQRRSLYYDRAEAHRSDIARYHANRHYTFLVSRTGYFAKLLGVFLLFSLFMSVAFGSNISLVGTITKIGKVFEEYDSLKLISISQIVATLNSVAIPMPNIDVPFLSQVLNLGTSFVNGLISFIFAGVKFGLFLIEGLQDLVAFVIALLQVFF